MNQPAFNTVRRGYDPAQVDEALRRARQTHTGALQEAAEKTVEVTRLTAELEAARTTTDDLLARTRELEEHVAALETASTTPLTYADLGPRISSILTLAEEEAQEVLETARMEAEILVSDATSESERLRRSADNYSTETRDRADMEVTRALEKARREADDVLDHAEREASARRREAEAVYEEQRAQAAAAAAEFEKTLASRRDKAATEFSAQMANHERALMASSEKLTSTEEEAALLLRNARSDAEAERERANSEASQLLDNARIHAERVRRDSERELNALASRRDSITEQLTNVRQMLATLGGGAAAALAGVETVESPEPVEEASGAVVATDGDGGEVVGDGEGAVELASLEEE